VARSIWYVAVNSVAGFFGALGLFIGNSLGASFMAIAVLKPIFPGNVGFVYRQGSLVGFGARFPVEPGQIIVGGYWVIPVSLTIGLLVLVGTHRVARRWLTWFRERREQRLRLNTMG